MKKTLHYNLFASAIMFQVITFQPCLPSTTTLATDQASLLALKAHITLDPHRILTGNWTDSNSVCGWIGVTCGRRHQRVTALNMSNMELSGNIPPQLGNLSFLVSLDLSNNFLSGTLPSTLSLLHRLKIISLAFNNFTGKIPEELGSLYNLKTLDMQSNMFSGAIPSAIFNISTLKTIAFRSNQLSGGLSTDMCKNLPFVEGIHLSRNQLSGQIPSNMSQCSRLQILYLSYNFISGQIPMALGNLKFLQYLDLGANNLTGIIPQEIGNLQNLVVFGIESNNIIGALPLSIFNMSSLEIMHVWRNKLSGNLSKDIGNLTMLRDLSLDENNFTGVIPREVGQLYQLEILSLGINTFTGSIPPELFNISTLQNLVLSASNLSGALPTNLCDGMPSLQGLYLANNFFSGAIPTSLSYCTHLKVLDLGGNKFTGFFPQFFGNLTLLEDFRLSRNNLRSEPSASELSFINSFTNCRFLIYLLVSGNPLDGVIPASIGNLSSSSFHYFAANNCKIKGSIPIEIGNLSSLVVLDLGYNELSGNIPLTLGYLHNLQGLLLYNNKLEGPIQEQLCHLQSLNKMTLHQNQLSGPIPECIGNVTSLREIYLDSNMLTSTIPSNLWNLKDLLYLYLSSNSLSGFLPVEMGNLAAAIAIDLSINQLSGSIPTTIEKLQNLNNLFLAHNKFEGSIPVFVGSMISLVGLDFSYNNLSGPIPKTMEALQYLKSFNVSFNALSGEIPTGGPFRDFTMDSFKANKALCGIPRYGVPNCQKKSNHRPTRKKVQVALFVSAGVIMLITIASLPFILSRYKRKDKTTSGTDVLAVPERISYYEILHATELFNESNLLGVGSFGTVYKGILRNGLVCAVKVFNLQFEAAFKSFDVECEVLRNIRHRNLTKVISSCSNEDFKALILEYMPNGDLEKWLYSHNHYLDVMQRLNIMIDVASALEYLHHGYSSPIVHCDLKPSNVLLDEEMIAHVSDFGIAKLLGEGESIVLTNTIATLGYIAPEYGLEGVVSKRSDVYSYGVLLMETFTRKRPSDDMFSGDLSLNCWVERSIQESSNEVIDEILVTNLEENQNDKILQYVSSILVLALKCAAESPGDRINMKEALAELQKIKFQFSR